MTIWFTLSLILKNKTKSEQPSRYRELLLEKTDMVVDGKRVTGQKKYIDGQVSDKCLTNDGQVSDKCPHSIGKDRIGEYRIGEDSLVESRSDNEDDAGQKSFSKIIKDSNIKC